MSGLLGFKWTVPPSVISTGLDNYGRRVLAAAFELGVYFAATIEAYAKQNAVWTDRTGNARQGLTAKAFKVGTAVVIYLFHTMSYGKWLEIAHAGRFAIILRTLEFHYPLIMDALRKLVGGR